MIMNDQNDGRGSTATYRARGSEAIGFPRKGTALLVIDPVNDFLSEGGAAWEMTKSTVQKNDVVENLKRAIAGAHERNLPVLFGPMAYTEEDYAEMELHRRTGINRMMFEHRMFQAGSWGADFHPDLQPRGDDIVLLPHKGTDVFETDLPDQLDRLGITHLVVAGMTANLCVESTARHAAEAGYDVTVLYDAMGSESLPSYEASVHLNFPLIANGIMKVSDFLAAVDESDADRGSVKKGDVVRGSDHGKIGEIEEVVQASGEHEAYMLVPRGLVFEKDTYIPLDAVVRRAGGEIFINIPKLVVGKMPWSEKPTRAGRAEKVGTAAASVEKLYRSVDAAGR